MSLVTSFFKIFSILVGMVLGNSTFNRMIETMLKYILMAVPY